ncbi:MAG TPA: lactonase family protein [Jatrophihabitans sp.]|jgi:6-phosphogluconolactonase (cycloisomerase 2 family)|uniref:lactonase family protein n=1 Tax=Jatrophihabitans sp. TaxID=1932789 RepID=UPI002F234E7E
MGTSSGFLLVGGYTPPTGAGQGILLAQQRDGGLAERGLSVATESPSFLAISADGNRVYAVNETDPGRVSAFGRTGSRAAPGLRPLGGQPTGGAHPCHLALHPSGRLLAVANYSSGSVAIHPLDDGGAVRPHAQLLRLRGSGPNIERQDGPHAHQVSFAAGGAELIVADLGSDRLWRYHQQAGGYVLVDEVSLPAGSGPRQLLLDPAAGRGYVLGELDNSISTLEWRLPARLLSSVAGHAEPLTPGTLSAALIFGPQPGLLYASHRGADRITVLRQDGDGVTPVADFDSHGQSPRHLSLSGDRLYIANQLSDTLAGVPVARDTGLPAGPVSSLRVPSPSCVLAW